MSRITTILCVLFFVAGTATTLAEDRALDTNDVADWLLRIDQTQSQAVGLVLRSAGAEPNPAEVATQLERIDAILKQDSTPVTLSLLALSCMQAGLQSECIDLGLDDAIVEHDRANLMVRGHLLAGDPDAFERAMAEAEHLDDRTFDMAVAVNDGLRAYAEAMDLGPLGSETQAMAFAMAWAIPALGPLSEACRTTDSAQVAVCEALATQAAASKSSLTTRMLDWSIRKQLAEAAGRPGEVEALESERRQVMSRFLCLHSSIPPDYWMEIDGSTFEDWMIQAAREGEWAAAENLAASFATDCLPDHETSAPD